MYRFNLGSIHSLTSGTTRLLRADPYQERWTPSHMELDHSCARSAFSNAKNFFSYLGLATGLSANLSQILLI